MRAHPAYKLRCSAYKKIMMIKIMIMMMIMIMVMIMMTTIIMIMTEIHCLPLFQLDAQGFEFHQHNH